jgi:uncharacterized protein YkwD
MLTLIIYLLNSKACDPKCQLRCLEMHNYYRSLHNSPPLSCDQGLAESAQTWTDQQANDGAMYSSAWTDQYTESISWKGEGWAGTIVQSNHYHRQLMKMLVTSFVIYRYGSN